MARSFKSSGHRERLQKLELEVREGRYVVDLHLLADRLVARFGLELRPASETGSGV